MSDDTRPYWTPDPSKVLFTFGDGRLSYDCVSCQGKCCKGFGFTANVGTELDHQVIGSRWLPVFIDESSAGAGRYHISNVAPGCFFLTDAGACGIQEKFGFDAKPETCRLFPFNNLRRVGDFVVVSPHPSLCPLDIVPEGTKSDCSTHAELLSAFSFKGVSGMIRPCRVVGSSVEAVVEKERRILEMTEGLGDRSYRTCVLRQMEEQGGEWSREERRRESLERVSEAMVSLLGVPPSLVADAMPTQVSRSMIAMTSFLRSQIVYEEADSEGPAHGVSFSYDRVPLALACLYLMAEAASAAGMGRVTFQSLSKIEKDYRPLASLLSRADEVLVWQHGAPIPTALIDGVARRRQFASLAKGLLPATQKARPRTLGELLVEAAPDDAVERVIFTKQAARHLYGRVTTLGSERKRPFPNGVIQSVRNRFHRWAMTSVDGEVLEAVYLRRRAGAANPHARKPEGAITFRA